MPIMRMLVLSGLLALPACSSSPTGPDQSQGSLGGSIVVPGGGSHGSNDPCGSLGRLAKKCVRKE
jgi:hypothetical protein